MGILEDIELWSEKADYSAPSESHETGPSEQSNTKQRLLFMGLKRSGKSSIINVVLYKMAPTDTLFIATTVAIKKHSLSSFRQFQIWDLPGQIDFLDSSFDTESIFNSTGAIVWIIDAQDSYFDSIARLVETMVTLGASYPDIKYSVFVHKMDSLNDDTRDEVYGDIVQRISEDVEDAGIENPAINYYATSVYDHSVYQALSKVLQTLNPQIATFESLLNTIHDSCRMQKVYLFDVQSKLYVASDTTAGDPAAYQLLSDWIDTIVDLSEIYGYDRKQLEGDGTEPQQELPAATIDKDVEAFVSGIRGGYCLYLREITPHLALAGISREERFKKEKAAIDYNVGLFQEAIRAVLSIT
ncbi:hypothetical protein MMC25_004003 [Agyrium rufum]|nr:hypothetical protein [Agyrium rufum]